MPTYIALTYTAEVDWSAHPDQGTGIPGGVAQQVVENNRYLTR